MIARRLLMGGGGAFVAPPVPAQFTVSAAPQGGYARGQAFYHAGYSYISTVNDAGGQRVAIFNHTTGAVTLRVLTVDGATPVDHHNNPGVCLRVADNRLFTVRSDHAGSNLYVALSVNTLDADPTISGGFGATTNIDSQVGVSNYTYAYPMDVAGYIFVFFREQDGQENWEVSSSNDGGTTWVGANSLFRDTDASGRAVKSSSTRWDVICNDTPGNIYHFYFESGAYKQSDGTVITSPPFAFSEMTKVWDVSTEGAGAGAYSIARVGSELGVTMQSGDSYYYGFWNGSAWSTELIVASIGSGISDALYSGMCFVDPADLGRVIVSRKPPSGTMGIYEYLTTNDGVSWSSSTIYTSALQNIYPTFVQGYEPELEFVWLEGTLTEQDDFDLGILGWGIPA